MQLEVMVQFGLMNLHLCFSFLKVLESKLSILILKHIVKWILVKFGEDFLLDGTEISDQKLQNITPVLGVNFKNFMFAYTYSYQIGNIKFDSGGFHQITLGYEFLGGRAEPYDCNCPAIN